MKQKYRIELKYNEEKFGKLYRVEVYRGDTYIYYSNQKTIKDCMKLASKHIIKDEQEYKLAGEAG